MTVLQLRRREGYPAVQFGLEDDTFLLVGIGTPAHHDHRLNLTPIDGDVGDPRRDVEVIAGSGNLVLSQLFSVPEIEFAAEHEKGGLMALMDVRLGPATRRDRDLAQPDRPRADAFGADATGVGR